MLNIQIALLDVMNYVVKELKKLNKYVSIKFHLYIKLYEDIISHLQLIFAARF